MVEKYNWKDLAGTGKKWLRNKITETTTADRRTRERAEGNDWQLEREMKEQAGGALLVTAFPGLGRALERQEENRERAAQGSSDRARAGRSARVVRGSSIELTGHVTGRVDDVAVDLSSDDENRTLSVRVEPVDPVQLSGGELLSAGFAIAGFAGEGTYPLVSDIESLDPGVHHVALGGESEDGWFYWTEDAGPGVACVRAGLIDASLVCVNSASDEIRVTIRIPLP
jgi:hypothetical protein